jgi:apolipoprotein D and lipocalin family protein
MKLLRALGAVLLLPGCQSAPMPPLAQVEQVDLARFMGDWYVIANIPTFIEKGAHNAIESYRLDADGTIATTFTFRAGDFDGKPKRYTPRGYVIDHDSNAVWAMQFIWPLKSDYRIAYLSADYSQTVIARTKRDYVWIMARTPALPPGQWEELVQVVKDLGYDTAKLRLVPQRWGVPPDLSPGDRAAAR